MKFLNELEEWFLAFWVIRYKVTYLVALIILIFWVIAVNDLPKESDPEVNLPLVSISTEYDWVSAVNIDEDITEEIEDSLTDIEGISSINSTSSEWRSNIRIEFDDGYDVDEKFDEVQDAVDSVSLPNWIDDDPEVNQASFTSTDMFTVILYAPEDEFEFSDLLDISETFKDNTSSDTSIKEVTIDTNTVYDIRVILSKEKLDSLGLSISDISSTISNNDVDSPIWTYQINWNDYSFSLSWKLENYNDILNIDILVWDSFIKLWDVADIDLYYWDEIINKFGQYQDSWYIYIGLTYSKLSGSNIFDVAPKAKSIVEEEIEKSIYDWVNYYYTNDESESVTDDFNSLYQNAFTTLILVFCALVFFVWFRESVIATIILPLAFLLSFIVVNYMWETLNQLTSFAFVLAFWIAIDTIIIVVEWAAEKVKQWFNPKTATLLALKEFKSPIIVGTLTTISAFIPILTLPGVMGIFLAYIPLVVFVTLVSTLIISFTVAWAIFTWLSKTKKEYEVFEEMERVMPENEMELLNLERKWKTEKNHSSRNIREKLYDYYSAKYKLIITKLLKNKFTRTLTTITPIIILIVFCVTLLPKLWFELFPTAAQDAISLTVTWPEKYEPSDMEEQIDYIDEVISNRSEILDYTLSVSWNKISMSMNLTDSLLRDSNGELWNTELQTYFTDLFKSEFASDGFNVWASSRRRWPSSSDPVWIYLTTTSASLYNDLIELSYDFEDYLTENELVSSVTNSASNPMWEVKFEVNSKQAALLWLTEKEIFSQVSSSIRWTTVTSITWISDDNDVIVYFDQFLDEVKPSDIENIKIYSWGKVIKAWSVIDYSITKTSPTIVRWDWDIQVWISASVYDTSNTTQVQTELQEFAKQYDFPAWITYKNWWENEENSDLIWSVFTWLFVAFFLIFFVLVYQFNSYVQPAAIMYSVLLSLIWVIFGLYVTWNPLSMTVWIWFISLMWIVVNDAIIMIDKINWNLEKWMDLKLWIIEWSVSRLNPVLVTTITTAAWILPIAFQDVFWAWLWFTIAFGLTTWSLMTLFVIPTLYYFIESFGSKTK